jgi:hypothetical protein
VACGRDDKCKAYGFLFGRLESEQTTEENVHRRKVEFSISSTA